MKSLRNTDRHFRVELHDLDVNDDSEGVRIARAAIVGMAGLVKVNSVDVAARDDAPQRHDFLVGQIDDLSVDLQLVVHVAARVAIERERARLEVLVEARLCRVGRTGGPQIDVVVQHPVPFDADEILRFDVNAVGDLLRRHAHDENGDDDEQHVDVGQEDAGAARRLGIAARPPERRIQDVRENQDDREAGDAAERREQRCP